MKKNVLTGVVIRQDSFTFIARLIATQHEGRKIRRIFLKSTQHRQVGKRFGNLSTTTCCEKLPLVPIKIKLKIKLLN